MIDVHCHLLPGIDDGATDIDNALALARLAVADGISHAVATPHIHVGRFENNRSSIEAAHKSLQQALKDAEIPLQLSYAAEVRFDVDIIERIEAGDIPFLGQHEGQPLLLLEFPHGQIPPGADTFIQLLRDKGLQVLIAHPERNKDLMRDPSKLKPLLELGCLLQVTAGSVAGRFGDAAYELAIKLLKEDKVAVLASDAHNEKYRPPLLSEGVKAASDIIGFSAAMRLVDEAPRQFLEH